MQWVKFILILYLIAYINDEKSLFCLCLFSKTSFNNLYYNTLKFFPQIEVASNTIRSGLENIVLKLDSPNAHDRLQCREQIGQLRHLVPPCLNNCNAVIRRNLYIVSMIIMCTTFFNNRITRSLYLYLNFSFLH